MNERQKEVIQTQIDEEKAVLERLKLVYAQAQDDCANKIIDLSRRRDMENLQSIIYQKKYQEALKGQIDNILDKLHNNEYKTVSEYLHDCYENGYISTMYDLAGQDIPLILPIDQQQVVKAVELDAKLTTKKRYTDEKGDKVSLYEKLGANVDELKEDIRFQVARGIVNGLSWNEIGAELAKGMKHTPFDKAINRTITIARTEGHRIQTQAAMDAQYKAKEKGADILKQWDSTLDGRTRDTHRRLDGQIREVDEYFEIDGKKALCPGGFSDPAEDCNCRCALLQRARWALDDEELDELKERAEYFGLDKTKDFEEFKEKYLAAVNEAEKRRTMKIDKQCADITEHMLLNAEIVSNEAKEEQEYIFNGKKYIVDGKSVKFEYDSHEKEIGDLIASTLGGEVLMVPKVNSEQKIRTPDYLWNGERTDLKTTIDDLSKNYIYNRAHEASGQANNLIFDITNSLHTQEELFLQAERAYKSAHLKFIDKIIFVKNNKIIKIYKRV